MNAAHCLGANGRSECSIEIEKLAELPALALLPPSLRADAYFLHHH
jgi:hypothetical protein